MTAQPHTCGRGHVPSPTCYVNCRCRCRDCRGIVAAKERRRTRDKAYGTYRPYVDAAPVREHVRSLMPGRRGDRRGMGLKRIAMASGVSHGSLSKLIYGDPRRGMPPSRRVSPDTAERLLAIDLDLAGGAMVPARATRHRLTLLIEEGYAKAELARYISGRVDAVALQVARGRYVEAATAEAVERLFRDHRAGRIVPRGRWPKGHYGPKPPFPARPAPADREISGRLRCEVCHEPPLGGGRWCATHYFVHAPKWVAGEVAA